MSASREDALRISHSCLDSVHESDKEHNYFDFSGELSEGAESPKSVENKNARVDGEFTPYNYKLH